ncbi:signal peptidase I [Lactococcus garvieae]|uniref:signal peptidase I n=1 Tax=Lactococcus garvieae TaxID=1363 RepID=UPI0018D6062B|nr:signal peptidase I [Lactococcus garvieae]QPS71041.1 signal peptidase I [Lactococcus garvieae]
MNKVPKKQKSEGKVVYHDLSGGEDFATAACDFPEDIQAIQERVRAAIRATEASYEASILDTPTTKKSFEKVLEVHYPSSQKNEPTIVFPAAHKVEEPPSISAQSVVVEPKQATEKAKKKTYTHEAQKKSLRSNKLAEEAPAARSENSPRQEGSYLYYNASPKEAKHYPTIVVNKLTVSTAPRAEFYKEHQLALKNEGKNKEASKFKPKPKSKGAGILSNTIFYLIIILLLVFLESSVILQNENDKPVNLAGFSPMTVLSNSMKSVYPKGSLLVTRQVNPQTLNIGDDITFITEANRTVTHRIVGIEEDYLRTRERGFVTKGVDNAREDAEIVHANNVVGRVIFSSYPLGRIVQFIREHLVISVILMLVLVLILHEMLSFFITRLKQGKTRKNRRIKPKNRVKRRKVRERKVLSHEAI